MKSKNPFSFEGKNFYKEVENAGGPAEFSEKIKNQGHDSAELWSQKNILYPENIRSTRAAFDPRFKGSSLLMAGGLAAPASTFNVDMNPLPDIKKGLGYYEQAKRSEEHTSELQSH